MSIVGELATSLHRRDEVPNQELARKIAKTGNATAISELIELLGNKSKDLQHDSIKVLYEIGEQKAELIAEHIPVFVSLLHNKNNRLQWGAMAALDGIAADFPDKIFANLTAIVAAMDAGSVITKDRGMHILVTLSKISKYYPEAFALIQEQVAGSAINQLPMYAEMVLEIVQPMDKPTFARIIQSRLADADKESKRKRLEKVIQKLLK